MSNVLIIGAGYAGLTAGWQAAKRGHNVHVIAKGWGATHWLSGCVDVLGYQPLDNEEAVTSPAAALTQLVADHPQHPYALMGQEALVEALAALCELSAAKGYPLHGTLDQNWLLPSGVGVPRPTCLAPETMIGGDMRRADSMLIVGFTHFSDFHAKLIADNISSFGIPAAHVTLDLPALGERLFTNPTILALLMEQPAFRQEMVSALRPHLGQTARIGFPSVMGTQLNLEVKEALERDLQRPVFEIPTLTPSIPGMRLQRLLVEAIREAGSRVTPGIEVLESTRENGRVSTVYSETPTRNMPHRSDHFILSTGGILGGGIVTDYAGQVRETIFDLPVSAPDGHHNWFYRDFMDQRGHPIYRSGITVNDRFQPVDDQAQTLYENLTCIGTTLAHAEVIRERSFEGVAIGSGFAAAQML